MMQENLQDLQLIVHVLKELLSKLERLSRQEKKFIDAMMSEGWEENLDQDKGGAAFGFLGSEGVSSYES